MARLTDGIPHPFDWAADLAIWTAIQIGHLAVHITRNVAELGVAWAVAYWITVALLVDLGTWGWEQANKALRGNDILEVRYAGWLGRFSAFVLRGVVRGRTWPATAAVYIGWPGAAALIGIGILWRWLFVIPAALIAHHALAARQARIMNERRRLP